jgi:hypothetical protein
MHALGFFIAIIFKIWAVYIGPLLNSTTGHTLQLRLRAKAAQCGVYAAVPRRVYSSTTIGLANINCLNKGGLQNLLLQKLW